MPDVKPIIHVTFCGAEGAFIVWLVFFGFVRSANYRAIVQRNWGLANPSDIRQSFQASIAAVEVVRELLMNRKDMCGVSSTRKTAKISDEAEKRVP